MSVEENKAVAKRWAEIFGRARIEELGEVLAENYTHYNPADSAWSPEQQGLEQVTKQWKKGLEMGWLEEHPTFRISVDDIIGEGDKVVVRMTSYEEGKPLAHTIAIYRFSDGKIVDDWYSATKIKD